MINEIKCEKKANGRIRRLSDQLNEKSVEESATLLVMDEIKLLPSAR